MTEQKSIYDGGTIGLPGSDIQSSDNVARWTNPSTDKFVMNGEPLSTKQLHELITSQALTIDKLYSEVGRLNYLIGLLRNWVKAYPLDMFPEPDLKLARKLLEDGGVNYSALNVYSMRHVINGVGKIIDEALGKVNE